jgi:hypothetical protein
MAIARLKGAEAQVQRPLSLRSLIELAIEHQIIQPELRVRLDCLRSLKSVEICYLKERNYSASLAKLQHEVRDRNYRYSLWQTEMNVFRSTVRSCLCKR